MSNTVQVRLDGTGIEVVKDEASMKSNVEGVFQSFSLVQVYEELFSFVRHSEKNSVGFIVYAPLPSAALLFALKGSHLDCHVIYMVKRLYLKNMKGQIVRICLSVARVTHMQANLQYKE